MPTRRILHTTAIPQAAPATGVNKSRVHNVLARLTRLVRIISQTPKNMISFMVCWVSFLHKALLIVNPYVCFLLAVMISSLSNQSR